MQILFLSGVALLLVGILSHNTSTAIAGFTCIFALMCYSLYEVLGEIRDAINKRN